MPQASDIHLTPEQLHVIEANPNDHYVVTAVAGSGKTTTLAHRIVYLLAHGYDAQRILILMFNKAAKTDFAQKLRKIGQGHSRLPEVRTFHAMGYRLYNRFVQEGYLRPFNKQVLSDKEVDFHIWRMLNQILDPEALKDAKRNKKDYVEASHQYIEAVKNSLMSPQETFDHLDLNEKFDFLPRLFDVFENWRKDNSRITYTDMLYDTVLAIQSTPALVNLVSNKMDIVLVDEYQDTNDLQHALLSFIAGDRAKVTVVGDPDQTIYEFRGAKPEYIIEGFSQQFSGTIKLNLSYSFRYGHCVSLLANHLISNNSGRQKILCKSHDSNPSTQVEVLKSKDDPSQVINILSQAGVSDLSDYAILARVWSQTVGIELALLEAGINYHMDGYPGVFHSKEAQSICALLELACGHFHNMPPEQRAQKLDLLFHFPHVGLPDTQIKALCHQLSQYHSDWGMHLREAIPEDIKRIQAIKLERLAKALAILEKKPQVLAQTLSCYFNETELYEGIRSLSLSHDHAEEKVASIQGIARFLAQHKLSLSETLQLFIQLQLNSEQRNHKVKTHDCVQLSTIHRAKGLEWKHVIIPGLNGKTFPYSYKDEMLSKGQLESERRLLYVAMTRAKEQLYLLVPDETNSHKVQVSRFKHELNITQSIDLGSALDSALDNEEREVSIARPSRIAEQYVEELAKPIIFKAKSKATQNEDDIIWFANKVKHVVLGLGWVKQESGNAFSVEFEDQEVRTFSKETADRFFTILE
jgi:DNA helicase-2/ATP-dependent DNA helicase PcrA